MKAVFRTAKKHTAVLWSCCNERSSQLIATVPQAAMETINSLICPLPFFNRCFNCFLLTSIFRIRAVITPSLFSPPHREIYQKFISFHPVSQSELLKTISSMKSSSSFLRTFLNFCHIFQQFLISLHRQGSFLLLLSSSAVVQPLLKRSNFDTENCNNFRPVSKLQFGA